MVQLYDYYPYGSELLDSQPTGASVPSEHSFTDKELDDDLGLYYFEARWYDSDIGRFSSQDPAQLDNRVFKLIQDPQSLNFYAYSRNNPMNLVDPDVEMANPIEAIRANLRLGVSIYYRQTGNYWTSVLFQHSLQNNPRGLHFDESTNLVSQIKASDEYQAQLSSITEQIGNGELADSFDIKFESGDLSTAIGKIQGTWEATQLENGQYEIGFDFLDQYNFEYNPDYESTALNTANNSANTLETFNVINEYTITASFEEQITTK
mgnify:CR=1 FL=1